MTLTEFLLARIAEDERAPHGFGAIQLDPDTLEPLVPARLVAECDAKRQALRFAELVDEDVKHLAPVPVDVVVLDTFARILATPYADHPDYRDEWKP